MTTASQTAPGPTKIAGTPPQATLQIYQHNMGQQRMPVCELVLLQSNANYTWLVWTNGQRLLMPRTLKYYESKLPTSGFVRLHRNCTVNVQHIKAITRKVRVVEVQLSNGVCLTVARRRWTLVKRQFSQLGIS
ncbi:LytTR family transcriptional regulator DNA-binding domain-containing protein [Fibrella sp. HMF5335]|uniref:LytTR family transcriptional regulator DNA-binding domain-containing protein n=1 Tax=Fibrella rubiginis TaxID=2817060 RepID=A0A939GGH4_9BACT|nr:LytTR family DNA-binding domain-containing protein [Fibrella rubiginis]MBO0938569.1 LytTR family transcriptional regulator DNA-binding domain-containing protein [Fibrella rubiginis]